MVTDDISFKMIKVIKCNKLFSCVNNKLIIRARTLHYILVYVNLVHEKETTILSKDCV